MDEATIHPLDDAIETSQSLARQRYRLSHASLPVKKQESGVYDVGAYAVGGILVIGRTPDDRDRQKSLELFRHDLKSVLIVTYDELLAKL